MTRTLYFIDWKCDGRHLENRFGTFDSKQFPYVAVFLMDFARFEWMWFMTRQTFKNNQIKITRWPGFLPRGPKQRKGQRFSRSKMSVLTETGNVDLVITNTVSSCGFLHKLLFIVDTEREDNHGIPHYIFNDTSAIFKMTGYDDSRTGIKDWEQFEWEQLKPYHQHTIV